MNKITKALASIVLCQLAGIVGSVFTFSAITEWYAFLNKPFFSPPNWLFAPVWLILYTLMGIAFFLVWEKGLKENNKAVNFFYIQLGLNALWSILFFGLRSPVLGLAGIVLLWVFIVLTIKEFYSIDKRAAYLLIPYILWVSFAAVLNYFVFVLN
ncbi:MAG: TspO/MBR family protein [archaeon]